MRGGEDTADAQRLGYLDGGLYSVAHTGKPDIHHAQRRALRRGKRDRLVGRRRDARDLKSGVGQGRLHLGGDQEIVLDNQNALGGGVARLRTGALVVREHYAALHGPKGRSR